MSPVQYISKHNIILIMTKRAAAYDIDEHTFEEKERRSPLQQQEQDNSHMAGRKIYKIARSTEAVSITQHSKITLKIQGLDGETPDQTQKTNLTDKPIQSIFDTHNNGIGLFTNPGFSNIFLKKQPQSLSQTTLQKTPTSMANSTETAQKESIFTKNTAPQTLTIFAKQLSKTPNIFGTKPNILGTTKDSVFTQEKNNIFGKEKSLFAGVKEEEEDDGNSSELAEAQKMSIDPAKSEVHFEYPSECKVLASGEGSKFKKTEGDLVERVLLSILLDEKSGLYYLSVQLKVTKNIIFRGLVVPQKSTLRSLNNKIENMEVVLFNFNANKQLQSHRVKLQIAESNTARNFYEILEQIIAGKKQPEQNEKKESEKNIQGKGEEKKKEKEEEKHDAENGGKREKVK